MNGSAVERLALSGYALTLLLLSFQQGLTVYAKVAGLVLTLLFGIRVVQTAGRGVVFWKEYQFLAGWFLIAVVSSFIAERPEYALPKVITLAQVYGVAFVTTFYLAGSRSTQFYWVTLVLGALVAGVVGVIRPSQFTNIDGRMFGTLDNPNTFAAMMAFAIAICLSFAVTRRHVAVRAVSLVAVAALFYLVQRSGSRTGMAASVAGVVAAVCCLYAMYRRRGVAKAAIVVLGGIGVATFAGAYFLTGEFGGRLDRLIATMQSGEVEASRETSLVGRAWMMRRAIDLAASNPVIGAGLDAFKALEVAPGRQIGFNSHSNYLELVASTGFVGALAYFAIYVFWVRVLWRLRWRLHDPDAAQALILVIASFVVLVVLDVGQVTYYHKIPWLVMAGIVAELHRLRMRTGAHGVPGASSRRGGAEARPGVYMSHL